MSAVVLYRTQVPAYLKPCRFHSLATTYLYSLLTNHLFQQESYPGEPDPTTPTHAISDRKLIEFPSTKLHLYKVRLFQATLYRVKDVYFVR